VSGSRLGQLVRERRRELGITQEELEARSGISQTQISQIETGRTLRPEVETLERLAPPLALGIDELRVAAGWVEVKEVVVSDDGVALEIRGSLPGTVQPGGADRKGSEMLRVLPEMIGGALDPYAVEVNDDEWRHIGIVRGNYVVLDEPGDRLPEAGQLVCVSVDGGLTRLYRWSVEGGEVVLVAPDDAGAERPVVRVKDWRERLRLIGFYVYHLPPFATRPAPAGAATA